MQKHKAKYLKAFSYVSVLWKVCKSFADRFQLVVNKKQWASLRLRSLPIAFCLLLIGLANAFGLNRFVNLGDKSLQDLSGTRFNEFIGTVCNHSLYALRPFHGTGKLVD